MITLPDNGLSYTGSDRYLKNISTILADDNGLSFTGPNGYLKSISSIFKCIVDSLFLNNAAFLYYLVQ